MNRRTINRTSQCCEACTSACACDRAPFPGRPGCEESGKKVLMLKSLKRYESVSAGQNKLSSKIENVYQSLEEM